MFTICQGTCFCTARPEGKRGQPDTVLYCFGEVVLKKECSGRGAQEGVLRRGCSGGSAKEGVLRRECLGGGAQ